MILRSRGAPNTGPDGIGISLQPARSRRRVGQANSVLAGDGIEGNPDEPIDNHNDDDDLGIFPDANNNDNANNNDEDGDGDDGATSNEEEDNDEEDEGQTETVQVDDEFLGVLGTFNEQNEFQYAPVLNPTNMFARPLIAPYKSLPQFGKL